MQPKETKSGRFGVVVVAAGKSARFTQGGAAGAAALQKKPFITLGDKAAWAHSVSKFAAREDVVQILLVVSPEDREIIASTFRAELEEYRVELVGGGAERFLSVRNALSRLAPEVDFVAVHDAARPCVTEEELDAVFERARQTRAAMLAVPVVGSIKRARPDSDRAVVDCAVSRDGLWEAHTPQIFARELIDRAYRDLPENAAPTDDCELVAALGVDVALERGRRTNVKITTPDDLELAKIYLNCR